MVLFLLMRSRQDSQIPAAEFDWKTSKNSLRSKSFEQRVNAAQAISAHCSAPGVEPDEAEEGVHAILDSVFFRKMDAAGIREQIVTPMSGETPLLSPIQAARLLALAYQTCAGNSDLSKSTLDYIQGLVSDPAAGTLADYVQSTLDEFNRQVILQTKPVKKTPESAAGEEKKQPGGEKKEEASAEIAKKEKPKASEEKKKEANDAKKETANDEKMKEAANDENANEPKGEKGGPISTPLPSGPPQLLIDENEKSAAQSQKGAEAPVQARDREKPASQSQSGAVLKEGESPSGAAPDSGVKSAAEQPSAPAPTELTAFDPKAAQNVLTPITDPTLLLNNDEYRARKDAAKQLASFSQFGKDPAGALAFAKQIADGAASLDSSSNVLISVRSKNKATTTTRLVEMYVFASECVKDQPGQSASLLDYIGSQYALAFGKSVSPEGIARRQQMRLGILAFGVELLRQYSDYVELAAGKQPADFSSLVKPSATRAQAQAWLDANAASLEPVLRLLLKTGGLGTITPVETEDAALMRSQAVDALLSILKNGDPAPCALAAEALSALTYDKTSRSAGEVLGAIASALQERTQTKGAAVALDPAQQRALLEAAIRLDTGLEPSERLIAPPGAHEYDADSQKFLIDKDPLGLLQWISTRPSLLVHALMVSAGYVPATAFGFSSGSAPSSSMDPAAAVLFLDLLDDSIRSTRAGKGPQSLQDFGSDKSVSDGYAPPLADQALSSLYPALLRRLRADSLKYGSAELSDKARQYRQEYEASGK